jgi:hypothetical protein
MIAILIIFVLGIAAPLSAREIARKCRARPLVCHYIFADKVVRTGTHADGRGATVVGPYLSQYQKLLPADEAPFNVLKARNGQQVVFALAFEREFRLAGPIFVMYFLDRSGKVILRSEGDMILEVASLAGLLPSRDEFLVVSMRSEVGISHTTEVWALGAPQPKKLYFDAGVVHSIDKGNATQAGRIELSGFDPGKTLVWDERMQQLAEAP